MLYAVYSLLFSTWVILMTPVFLFSAIRHKKYLPSLMQRMGKLPATLKPDGRPTIWIHACSVGETLSVQPLAKLLHERFPDARLVFSAITKGGLAIARDRLAIYGEGNSFYFPVDLPFIARRVVDFVEPSALVIIDTEIWPNVLHEAWRRRVPVVMVNGRISARAFKRYQLVQGALGRIFENYSAFLMKAKEDAERIQRLGAPPSKITVIGNIKYDRESAETHVLPEKTRAIDEAFGITQCDAPIIVAGSTHEDEEKTMLDVLRDLRVDHRLARTRLMIAPRHPERFEAVAALIQREGFAMKRRSDGNLPGPDAEVLLLDTLGELSAAYQFATVAFVGGTLIPHGGQSVMEPAAWSNAIVIGPHMENFPGIIDDFKAHRALVQISALETDKEAQKAQLTDEIADLLLDTGRRKHLGEAANRIYGESQGATARAVDRIEEILRKSGTK